MLSQAQVSSDSHLGSIWLLLNRLRWLPQLLLVLKHLPELPKMDVRCMVFGISATVLKARRACLVLWFLEPCPGCRRRLLEGSQAQFLISPGHTKTSKNHLKIEAPILTPNWHPRAPQGEYSWAFCSQIGANMTPKIDPGDLLKATLHKNLQNSNPTLIYHTSAVSATPKNHRFGYPDPPFFRP